jgi:hypothetical protein
MPLIRISSNVRSQMKNMQQGQPNSSPTPRPQQKARKGDYIEYEEIK